MKEEAVERYPLTPLQEGMLFQRIYTGRPGVDLLQVSVEIGESLNVDAFKSAWRRVIERHPVLRTGIAYEGLVEPVQEVYEDLELPFEFEDLAGFNSAEQQRTIESFERADRQRGFESLSAPLMRVKLFRRSAADYRMLLSIHHIIVDGRACQLILQEVFAYYEAAREGKSAGLVSRPPFRGYVEWVKSLDLGGASEFWREKLKGFSCPTPVLTEAGAFSASNRAESTRTEQRVWIPKDLSAKARELMRSSGLTLNTLVQGVWAIVLSRYSGEEDIVFGATKTTRRALFKSRSGFESGPESESGPGAEAIVGALIATIPVRIKVRAEASVLDWLKELRQEWLSYRDFDHTSLAEIQQASEIPQGSKLFDTLVVFEQGAFDDGLKAGDEGWRKRSARLISADTNYALTLMAYGGDKLELRLCYDEREFSSATVERMLGHLETVLQLIVEDPQARVSELELLRGAEREHVLEAWNATARLHSWDKCIHELFETQVERRRDAVAVVSGEGALSYRELNEQANRLAHYLRKRGAGVGTRVGVYVERGLGMMVGLLGVLKSGAAYVPLDPEYPAERVRMTLEDAQVKVIVTERKLLDRFQGNTCEVVCLETSELMLESAANPESGVSAEDLAYVIFTSGSTGKPKGVEIRHRGVVNLLKWMAEELEMGEEDVFPALASYGFDMSVPELYLTLVSGGRVAVAPAHLGGDGGEFAKFLRRHGATIVHATPTTWSLLLEAGYTGQGVKRCIGAEPLPRELFERLMQAGEGTSLYNFYGPTETTVWSTYHRFESAEEPIVIGRPLANTQVYILDKYGKLVPVGVTGELHIGGEGVAQGYLKRSELTAEKFVANRFSKTPGARMYKTGDLGRWLADGRIECIGRSDHQVKVRGFRVELGEIENALGQHASVKESVVVVREDVAGDKRLVAYVVPGAGAKMEAGELRSYLKERLPEYMVPVGWVEMEKLPLTPNRKIDRKNLPKPEYGRIEQGERYVQAESPTEELIAGIWSEVLKVSRIGVHDNFFELGGHSLLATQAMLRVRHTFHVDLSLRTFFEAPTVAELARCVEGLLRAEKGDTVPAIRPAPRDRALPLSFAQQRLWFAQQMDPQNSFYSLPFAMRMVGPLQVEVLQQSLNEVVRRHESLRTTFSESDGEVLQAIAPALEIQLPVMDLTGFAEAERIAKGQEMAKRESHVPFDLEKGPLFRAVLLRLSEEDHVLVLNMHHIVSDGWSRGVLNAEIEALYEAFAAGKASPLAELAIQYADYAVWQREWLKGEVLAKQIEYWRAQLRGAPAVLELPLDRARPAVQSFEGAVHAVTVSADLASELRRWSRGEGTTLFMTLAACFQLLLSRYSGQQQIVVGTDLANRTSVELERLIGFFVNVLPLRTDLSGDPTFRELVGRVRETSLGAYAHQEMPFDKLVEELSPERTLSHNPVVQVLFVMHNTPHREIELPEVRTTAFEMETTKSKFDIAVFVQERGGELAMEWLYSTGLFEAQTMARMAAHYTTLLGNAVANTEARISTLDYLTAVERAEQQAAKREHQSSKASQLRGAKRKTVPFSR